MKIINEIYLEAPLYTVADLVDEHEQLLIKRSGKEPVILMSLEEYNKLKAESYKGKKES